MNIFNRLNDSQINVGLFRGDVNLDDVIDLGTLKLRHKRSGLVTDVSACAVKTEK